MIYGNSEVVNAIRNFIENKRSEKNIINKVVKNDIFAILEKESVLLYYPLDDEVKGIHVEKVIADEVKQFVFINTNKYVDEQTWTAAHELGHVWKVDSYVYENVPNCDISTEDIVNRFAAEILLPAKVFEIEFSQIIDKLGADGSLSTTEFIKVIAYLMNYFCAPYKAVIRRLVELGNIDKQYEDIYIESFRDNKDIYDQVIRENYYPLLNRKSSSTAMSNISVDIDLLEEHELASEKMIRKYRNMFNIQKEEESDETFVIGGQNGTE